MMPPPAVPAGAPVGAQLRHWRTRRRLDEPATATALHGAFAAHAAG